MIKTVLAAFLAIPSVFADEAEQRAASLVAKMSLEEKVSQLNSRTDALPRLGLEACDWWNEALHGAARSGLATVFPQTIGRAAAFDERLEYEVGTAIGTEVRAKANEFAKRGIRCRYANPIVLSPTVNLFRDPRWGRGQETFGEDPFLAGRLGAAFVRGMQGDDSRFLRVTACAKHFAVHSGPEQSRLSFDARVSERDLREYYLAPFEALVKEGRVATVMASYNAVNGIPATANRWLLTDLLRGDWGFNGCVISDAAGAWYLWEEHRMGDKETVAAKALSAGLDVEIGPLWRRHLADAVRKGLVAEGELDKTVVRVLAMRIRLGLMEKEGQCPYDALNAANVDTADHRALALRSAARSLVLLKNDRGALPLERKKIRRVCVVGPRALDEIALYGNYYGIASHSVPIMSGIARAAGPGVMVNDLEFSDNADHPLDAVVVCIGLTADMEGEEVAAATGNSQSDRGSLSLPPGDIELLRKVRSRASAKIPVIAVVTGGSPLDLREASKLSDALILAWYPGEEGGTAVGQALFGDFSPAGRLPVTFPCSDADIPPISDYSLVGRTYLYAQKAPLYPFGYGLSYTDFAYSEARAYMDGDNVKASVRLRNIGERTGDEVVQVYLRSPEKSGDRRLHHLAGFCRTSLKPGEDRIVEFSIPRSRFAVFGENGMPQMPTGAVTVFLGGGQPGFAQTVSCQIEVK